MDAGRQLPRDLYYQLVHALRDALPPPVTDSPEDLVRRDNAIIAQVASLLPANPDEVILAAQCVAASAQALDCLRLARLYPDDAVHVLKCTAQSASMMRQSRGALGQLQRLQAARDKGDADASSRDQAATREHAAITLLSSVLADPRSAPRAEPLPRQPASVERSRPPTEAEKYALAHPSSAALIRSLGRLPKKFAGGPMPPELVRDLVNGGSPILQALVKQPAHRIGA
jgi:hypothetical protein